MVKKLTNWIKKNTGAFFHRRGGNDEDHDSGDHNNSSSDDGNHINGGEKLKQIQNPPERVSIEVEGWLGGGDDEHR